MFSAIKLLVVAAIRFKKIHSSLPKLYYCYCFWRALDHWAL